MSLVPLVAAVLVAALAGGEGAFDPGSGPAVSALCAIVALVAVSVVVEVVGHELVGYTHTVRVVERQLAEPGGTD